MFRSRFFDGVNATLDERKTRRQLFSCVVKIFRTLLNIRLALNRRLGVTSAPSVKLSHDRGPKDGAYPQGRGFGHRQAARSSGCRREIYESVSQRRPFFLRDERWWLCS